MHLPTIAAQSLAFFSTFTSAAPIENACTFAQKVAGIQWEIDTISSHSFTDADNIPLAPFSTRTFLVTPNELNGVTLPPINVGITADTIRLELVALATVLNAYVPSPSVHYINNRNGSVTVDFIQNDLIALPHEHVREIHTFNDDCQITSIIGYVHGRIICPGQGTILSNSVVNTICGETGKGGLLGGGL